MQGTNHFDAYCAILYYMGKPRITHQIPEPTDEDLKRLKSLLHRIGGKDVIWGSSNTLEVWVIEQRIKLDQRMSERIRASSWALVFATIGLVACTAGLIWATLAV